MGNCCTTHKQELPFEPLQIPSEIQSKQGNIEGQGNVAKQTGVDSKIPLEKQSQRPEKDVRASKDILFVQEQTREHLLKDEALSDQARNQDASKGKGEEVLDLSRSGAEILQNTALNQSGEAARRSQNEENTEERRLSERSKSPGLQIPSAGIESGNEQSFIQASEPVVPVPNYRARRRGSVSIFFSVYPLVWVRLLHGSFDFDPLKRYYLAQWIYSLQHVKQLWQRHHSRMRGVLAHPRFLTCLTVSIRWQVYQ